ncbi:Hypothetical protein D9617_3g019160 [Elsinoe fawcettii]|nr:Hypothetical protein D9617_3g019160 [Elsinoe fawcettii]
MGDKDPILVLAVVLLGLYSIGATNRPHPPTRQTAVMPWSYNQVLTAAAHDLAEHISDLTKSSPSDPDPLSDARWTAYLIGRYLAWARLRTYHSQLANQSFTEVQRGFRMRQRALEEAFADGEGGFRLSRARMQGIGEVMTVWVEQHERWRCMGFVDFERLWRDDGGFRGWFEPVIKGREEMGKVEGEGREEVTVRLGRVRDGLMGVVRYELPKNVEWPLRSATKT